MPDVEAQDPRSGLLTWAADQDEWIRWIVAEVIASGLGLGEGGLTEALGRLLAEKGLSDETFEPAPAMAEPSAGPGSAEPLELTMLSECAGVNALAPGQAIEFNPRMTLLYGENASGKSGTCASSRAWRHADQKSHCCPTSTALVKNPNRRT